MFLIRFGSLAKKSLGGATLLARICTAIVALSSVALSAQTSPLGDHLNYTYLYYENGYPTRLAAKRSPESDANIAARNNPDLVFQTGYYSLMLDTDDVAIKGYNQLAGSDYMSALNEDVTSFTPATLNLFVYVNGSRYICVDSIVLGTDGENYVRMIESGQFMQRIDHVNLTFKSQTDGSYLTEAGVLEIAAWPDRFTLTLDCSGITGVTRSTIQFIEPDGTQHLIDRSQSIVRLTHSPIDAQTLTAADLNTVITQATRLSDGLALNKSFESATNALNIEIPTAPYSYPSDKDNGRLDEYLIQINNPTSSALNVPLVFEEPTPRAITGTSMTLCGHASATSTASGYPLGYPVQISKNWHNSYEDKYSAHPNSGGQWLRGSTMIKLEAGESKTFRLRVIKGYWNSVPAVSHAQLSLIGYGTNVKAGTWKWDESALGSWGESLTYDPSLHLSASLLNDIRPALTSPMNGAAAYSWTENVGGGNFLIYRDNDGTFRHMKRVKTAYKWTGPNMTEIHYSGVTDDNRIRSNNVVQLIRTYDYHRTFLSYEYEFLKTVSNPDRLTFFQMSADRYKVAGFSDYYYQNGNGAIMTAIADDTSTSAKGYYDSFAIEDGWIAFDDQLGGSKTARAYRGLIVRESTLDGAPFDVSMHEYQSGWGQTQLTLDLSAPDKGRSYAKGRTVSGTLELLLPAKNTSNYTGDDSEFAARLANYTTPYDAIIDEQTHNDYNVTVTRGTLVNNYPLELVANPTGAAVDVTINNGGIGHIPVIIKDIPANHFIRVQRNIDGRWYWLEDVNLTQNQNYYQATRNANGNLDFVLNIKRPDNNLNNSWRFRVLKVAY